MVYALSIVPPPETEQMARHDIQLGGKHWHYILYPPIEKGLSPHRKAELEFCKILRDPNKTNLVLSLDVICCDELGQSTVELILVIDIIMCKIPIQIFLLVVF